MTRVKVSSARCGLNHRFSLSSKISYERREQFHGEFSVAEKIDPKIKFNAWIPISNIGRHSKHVQLMRRRRRSKPEIV